MRNFAVSSPNREFIQLQTFATSQSAEAREENADCLPTTRRWAELPIPYLCNARLGMYPFLRSLSFI